MSFKYIKQQFITALMLVLATTAVEAQQAARPQPTWWFGASAAANFNFYEGTTQVLNNSVSTPTAFHKGNGIKPYISLLTEYRPNKVWGGMLNLAYDNRGGQFNTVMAPCDCPADLSTNLSYFSIEPALRVAPFRSSFYVFAGPTISFNMANDFTYTQEKQTDKKGEFSDMRKTILSAQAGAGIDIPVSSVSSARQSTLSPFVSFQTNFGRDPRETESWSLYTVRAGIAFKFGTAKKPAAVTVIADQPVVAEQNVLFTIIAPKLAPVNLKVTETFPFRNSVFFNMGSTEIPARYIQLNKVQATGFKETQLQETQPQHLGTGRSSRQLAVYHNILNIIGDRMRSNPQSKIKLTGSAEKNPAEGKIMAENVSRYLVNMFGISPSRISTVGRDRPEVPSEQPGAVNDIALLREGDRRVDIESNSKELLLQVGGNNTAYLKPVQLTGTSQYVSDSDVLFNVAGATEKLSSWSVNVKDEYGAVQKFGPFTKNQAAVPAKTILGNNQSGNYSITMTGQTKTGQLVTEKGTLSLAKAGTIQQEGLRYSILFDFDQSRSIASYEKFLTDVVTPLIPENGTVIIHGHTDIIGEEKYNQTLSQERAAGAQQIIERALAAKGKKANFKTTAYGEEAGMAPFENNLPEERFYNRTVVIDIVPGK